MSDNQLSDERARIASIPANCANTRLRRASRAVSEFYDEMFLPSGVHANQGVLLVPLYLAGSLTINELAQKLSLDRTTLTRNLKLLERQNLVTVAAGDDQRTRMVTLTEQGKQRLVQALPLWEEAQRRVIDGLAPDDLLTLMHLLDKVMKLTRGS